MASNSLYMAGMASSIDGYLAARSFSGTLARSAQMIEPAFVICCGVRIPATTSSPCALIRYSPLNTSSPLPASREKQTPVADVLPILPNTIACTFTAVPHSAGIPSILR
ncbi:hypothetical protein Barb7_02453 [Bacteroidales bacterium Barb7]|nr:hypothetical protein Barb7_02453 [Bacteroidales bacterium Barb7]